MHNAIVHNVGENGAPVKPGSRQGVGRDFDQVADPPPGAVGDLLAAGDAGCHDLALRPYSLAHREELAITDSRGQPSVRLDTGTEKSHHAGALGDEVAFPVRIQGLPGGPWPISIFLPSLHIFRVRG